jgi:hypothetical protein
MCLDFRAFRPVRSEVECFGCRPRITDKACDIEHSRERVGLSSSHHPLWIRDRILHARRQAQMTLPTVSQTNQQDQTRPQGHPNQQVQTHQQAQAQRQVHPQQQTQVNHQVQNDHQDHHTLPDDNAGGTDEQDQMDVDGGDDPDIGVDDDDNEEEDEDMDSYDGEMSPTSAESENLLDPTQTNAEQPNSLLHGEDFRRMSDLTGIESVSPHEQHPGHDLALPEKVPFLILWASDHNLALFGPRFDQPATIMINALQQNIPESGLALGIENYDRLNMGAQIPELGIVIIASQIGRVAVLSLNTRKTCKGSKRARYNAFRVDWFLPFKSQEDELLRPIAAPLLGIAVSPIQGQQHRPKSPGDGISDGLASSSSRAGTSSRRYRLMLTYYDHTVLSYELGRSGDWVDDGEVLIF